MTSFTVFYSSLPTRMRQVLAQAIVREHLASYMSRTASCSGSILRRYFVRVAPTDYRVFLEDLQQLKRFNVNGHVWVLDRVERKGNKRTLRVYFRRLD